MHYIEMNNYHPSLIESYPMFICSGKANSLHSKLFGGRVIGISSLRPDHTLSTSCKFVCAAHTGVYYCDPKEWYNVDRFDFWVPKPLSKSLSLARHTSLFGPLSSWERSLGFLVGLGRYRPSSYPVNSPCS